MMVFELLLQCIGPMEIGQSRQYPDLRSGESSTELRGASFAEPRLGNENKFPSGPGRSEGRRSLSPTPETTYSVSLAMEPNTSASSPSSGLPPYLLLYFYYAPYKT